MQKLMQWTLGSVALLGTLAALPASSSQAQEYVDQSNYYQYQYAPPPPPPPQVVVVPPPVVRYERPYDPAAAYWARRHWLRHHWFHHHHGHWRHR